MVESKNMKRIHQFLLVMTRQCLFMFCQVTATILLASSTTGDWCYAATKWSLLHLLHTHTSFIYIFNPSMSMN